MELPLSIIAWQTPRLEPDNCEVLGSGETHELGNLIFIIRPRLRRRYRLDVGRRNHLWDSGILVNILTNVSDVFLSHDELSLEDHRDDSINFKSWLFL